MARVISVLYCPVVNDADRAWARRLEWAINHHRDLAQSDFNGLQGECERVLRRSQSAAVRRDERTSASETLAREL